MPCCFYGKHWAGSTFGLVDSCGNQCALITRSYSPCAMEITGQAPEEMACLRVTARWNPQTSLDPQDIPPELRPRRIVSRQAEPGGGTRLQLACGHEVISIISTAPNAYAAMGALGYQDVPCAECVNEFVRKNRVRKDVGPLEDASAHG